MKLKEARKAAGFTQTQVAKELGINQNTYSYWKNGKSKIDNISIQKLATLFGVSVDYLLGRNEQLSKIIDTSTTVEEHKKIPIIGSVKCGPNGLAFQEYSGYLFINEDMHGEHFAFVCKGDSMNGIGINDGDLAIVRRQDEVECGELAVAVINGDEGTLKRVRKQDGMIILEAANPAYPPRVFTEDTDIPLHIVGKVLEVRKRF